MKSFAFLCLLLLAAMAYGGPTRDHKKRGPKDLSEEEHYSPGTEEHNPDFDHEAFLGKETADEMQQLEPEEQKRRLRLIFAKIDTDKNGFVDHDELKQWVVKVSQQHIQNSAESQIPDFDLNKDGKISLAEYHNVTLGEVADETAEYDPHRKLTYKEMKARDKSRFDAADLNKDSLLDKDEFAVFLHPEDSPHMREVVVNEALQDMDKDKDGFVTLEEYIEDIWPKRERQADEEEPDWVKGEREQFEQHRDKDNDKKLSKRELGDWIAPEGHDNAEAEARHLIFNADKDKDGKLTVDEVLANEELFVGSQATDFGNILNRHEEL